MTHLIKQEPKSGKMHGKDRNNMIQVSEFEGIQNGLFIQAMTSRNIVDIKIAFKAMQFTTDPIHIISVIIKYTYRGLLKALTQSSKLCCRNKMTKCYMQNKMDFWIGFKLKRNEVNHPWNA